jgi:hypothetical protein
MKITSFKFSHLSMGRLGKLGSLDLSNPVPVIGEDFHNEDPLSLPSYFSKLQKAYPNADVFVRHAPGTNRSNTKLVEYQLQVRIDLPLGNLDVYFQSYSDPHPSKVILGWDPSPYTVKNPSQVLIEDLVKFKSFNDKDMWQFVYDHCIISGSQKEIAYANFKALDIGNLA